MRGVLSAFALSKEMRYQKIIRHGNSLAVVIPAEVCRELNIHRGDGIAIRFLSRSPGKEGPKGFYLEIMPVVESERFTNNTRDD